MKILCATDFSAQAEYASRSALQLARRFGDSVVLAHVLEPPTSNVLEIGSDARRFESAMQAAAEKALDDAAAALRSYGTSVETVILRGHPQEALTVFAREIDARLIVLGSHGHKAPWRWFVGSVAERTQRLADRPVLIVREHGEGIGEWSSGKRPLRVVVGIDMSEASLAPVAFVKALRKKGPCRIDFVHASRPFAFQAPSDVLSLVNRALREQVGELEHAGDVSLRIVPNWNTDAESLAHYADAEKADLVVVGTHQRRGLDLMATGSVAREMVRLSHAPVLTVPTVVRLEKTAVETPRLATILVATDFSAEGDHAVRWAYAMARPGGQVILCHIAKHDGGAEPLERRLRELVPGDAFARGIVTQVIVRASEDGPAAIRDIAERTGANAICIGAHERSELLKLLAQKTEERLARTPEIPVFVIREGGRP